MEPHERIVFALDTDQADTALEWVKRLSGRVGWFKVGLELFTAVGPDLVRRIVELGQRVFLDLKLHDIPATVAGALRAASKLGAGLITVHIQAGEAWKKAVAEAESIKVLGITVLTSLSPEDLALLDHQTVDPSQLVALQAELAREADLAGVVCSGLEAALVRRVLGPDRLIVCPGIRPAWSLVEGDDQARVATPASAVADGADLIVIGRPIRTAPDMAEAADRVAAELSGDNC